MSGTKIKIAIGADHAGFEYKELLKDFLQDFYRKIIKIENYTNFENILTKWIKEFFKCKFNNNFSHE